jgi:hypothetical protein
VFDGGTDDGGDDNCTDGWGCNDGNGTSWYESEEDCNANCVESCEFDDSCSDDGGDGGGAPPDCVLDCVGWEIVELCEEFGGDDESAECMTNACNQMVNWTDCWDDCDADTLCEVPMELLAPACVECLGDNDCNDNFMDSLCEVGLEDYAIGCGEEDFDECGSTDDGGDGGGDDGGGAIEGCMDESACNYNSEATTDDDSCLYDDCAGECGGTAELDDCGECNGDGSSCEVYIELEITTTLDEPIEDEEELEEFEEDFESYMETELGLPDGTVEVTNIEFSETREVEVTIEFTITLTEEELAETDFDPETAEEDIESNVSDVEEEIEEGLPDFVEGCTDSDADNYNTDATIDDGSCEYSSLAPDEFNYLVTTLQAFYFIIDANIDGE